jgi:DNA-binding SARP family transcriptional activator/tetratricopeptide (TPR) repeat protein
MTETGLKTITVCVLGDARIDAPHTTLTPFASVVFAVALILTLDRDKHPSRRHIEELVWPRIDGKSRSHRFRQALSRLRSAGFEIGEHKTKVLIQNPVTIDIEGFLQQTEVESFPRDASILPGYAPRISAEFAEWIDAKRRVIASQVASPLLASLARHRERGNWELVERNAHVLLQLSPLNEEATLSLAEAYAMRGAKIDAVKMLDDYLAESGSLTNELRIPASTLRKRIVDRIQPAEHSGFAELPLLGRGLPMKTLADLLKEAKLKAGSTAIVAGEAGIGKTRLLAEFANFASLQGCAVQRVNCRPDDQKRPLSVVLDLLPPLRQLRGAIGCSPETMRYLDRITNVRDVDLNTTSHREDPDQVFAQIVRAVFDLFDAVSTDVTVVLIVEDVHWCDPISKRILDQMSEWCTRRKAFLICSTRHDITKAGIGSDVEAIMLAPLDDESAAHLMITRATQRGVRIDSEYLGWSLRIAEGNPYFLDELAKQWIEIGARHAVPASLQAIVDQRISRLRPDALQVLQTLAMLEDCATFPRLEATLRYQPYELLSALDELTAAGMITFGIHPDNGGRAGVVTPIHELVTSSALGRLSRVAGTYLHRRVATILEDEVANNTSAAMLWDSAKHWQAAGDPDRACRLARSCAAHLLEVGLPGEAAEAYQTALNFVPSQEDRLEVLRELTRANYLNAAWKLVIKTGTAAQELRASLHPHETPHDDIELMSMRALFRDGFPQDVLQRASECLKCADANADHKISAGALALMQLDVLGQHDRMGGIFDQIEVLSSEASPNLAALFEAQVVFHTVCGDLNVAIDSCEKLIAVQRQQGASSDMYRALTNASVTYRAVGAFQQAEQYLLEVVEISRQHRSLASLSRALTMLAHMAVERGDRGAANLYFERVKEQPESVEDVHDALDRGALGARLALLDKDPVTARRLYPFSLSEISQAGSVHMRSYQLALFIAIRMASGESVDPMWIRELEAAHLAARRCLHQAFIAYVLYIALVSVGQTTHAAELLHEYETKFRREPWRASKLFEDVKSILQHPDS